MYKSVNDVLEAMDFNTMLYDIKKIEYESNKVMSVYESVIKDLVSNNEIFIYKASLESRLAVIENDLDFIKELPDVIYKHNIHTESIFSSVKGLIKKLWEAVKNVLKKIWNAILKIVKYITKLFKKLFGSKTTGGGGGGISKETTSYYTNFIREKLKNVDVDGVLKKIIENFDEKRYTDLLNNFSIGDEFIKKTIKHDLDTLHDICVKYDLDMDTFPIKDNKLILGDLKFYGLSEYENKLTDVNFASELLPDAFINYMLPNIKHISIIDVIYTIYLEIDEEGVRSVDEKKVVINDEGVLISLDFPIIDIEESKKDDYRHHDGGRIVKYDLNTFVSSLSSIFEYTTDDSGCIYKEIEYVIPGKKIKFIRESKDKNVIESDDKYCYKIFVDIDGEEYVNLSSFINSLKTRISNKIELSKVNILDIDDILGLDLFIKLLKTISKEEIDKFKRYKTDAFKEDTIIGLADEMAKLLYNKNTFSTSGAGRMIFMIDRITANIIDVKERYENEIEGKVKLAFKENKDLENKIEQMINSLDTKDKLNVNYVNNIFNLLKNYSTIVSNLNLNIYNLIQKTNLLNYMRELKIAIRNLVTGLFIRHMVKLIDEIKDDNGKTK